MALDDNELILRAQREEPQAFEELVYRYDRQVLNIAMRFTGDLDTAKDIYQEVFLRVHGALQSFKFESQFSTWLYRIVTNVCLTFQARERRHVRISIDQDLNRSDTFGGSTRPLPEELVTEANSHRHAFSGELAGHISQAMESLSPQQRIVFVLRHFEGHKLKEIAAMLSCAEGTVKKHLFSGTHRLREQLREVCC